MYDVIIVGAGPAGLTAALYAGRTSRKILVLEAKAYGGQIIKANKIVNYPGILEISGFDFATHLYEQVKQLGVEIKYETVNRIDEDLTVHTTKSIYQAKSIIIATGSENKRLNLPRENEIVGKGISYCATCDGSFFKGKTVAVLGEDKIALEDVLYLADIVKKVYWIPRNKSEKENQKLVEEIKLKDNVERIESQTITSLLGEDKLEEIELDQNQRIKVDGLFIAIGQSPKNEIFKNVIDMNEDGYIVSDDGVHTSHPKIYVAGDTRVKTLRQLTTAVSDGAIAATTAIKEMED